jgi:hypothetical protein
LVSALACTMFPFGEFLMWLFSMLKSYFITIGLLFLI